MGWNDHIDFIETRCDDCGAVDDWEHWDDVAKVRYSGAVGEKLGRDIRKDGCCPHCGSMRGKPVDRDEEGY